MLPLESTMDSELSRSQETAHIALVNMPFAMADRPSIQCGLLKAGLTRAGHEVDVFYLNLELAAEFGEAFYRELVQFRTDLLLGEWLFSAAAFGYRPNENDYFEAGSENLKVVLERLNVSFEQLCQLRNEAFPNWIQRWAEKIDWRVYTAIGFTSTFEQNTAALALARAIKARHPEVTTIFGGANFDGDMGKEYVKVLPFVDYAVVGEGDAALPQIIERMAQGQSALDIRGVVGKSDGSLVANGPAPLVFDLNTLPDPDYDDYFDTLFRLGREQVLGSQPPLLLFESARGCWWGEKQHCTFCGLNNNGMKFRSKTPTEVSGQLRRMATRYKIINFEAVDNIMEYKYLEELCDPLSQEHYDYRLFYEVKANLSPSQLRRMAQAGIRSIQPGIESLNSHVLALMRKGITMLRNVRLLKWAYYYGMRVGWNILTGFPGEAEEDYEEQRRIIPLLRHLPPPEGCGRIWLERFSPYFFDQSFPVKNVRPLGVYRYVYPEDQFDLHQIAYFFEYEMDSTIPDERHRDLRKLVEDWKSAWKQRPRPALMYQRAPDWIQIIDRRTEEVAAHSFEGHEAAIYEFCGETDRTVDAICKHLAGNNGSSVDAQKARAALGKFCDLGVMIEEKGRFLSLALPVNRNW